MVALERPARTALTEQAVTCDLTDAELAAVLRQFSRLRALGMSGPEIVAAVERITLAEADFYLQLADPQVSCTQLVQSYFRYRPRATCRELREVLTPLWSAQAVRVALGRMVARGEIERVGVGAYRRVNHE